MPKDLVPRRPPFPKGDQLSLTKDGKSEEVRQLMRQRALTSVHYFSKVVLGYADLTENLHYPFCRWLEDTRHTHKRRGALLPRKHFKSTIVAKSYSLWRLLPLNLDDPWMLGLPDEEHLWLRSFHDPNTRVLIVGESDKVAGKNLKDIKHNIQFNPLFRWLFPDICPADIGKTTWTSGEILLPRSKSFDEDSIMTVGVGTSGTGFHYDLIIYDDIIGRKAAYSEALMKEAIDWFKEAPGLVNNPETVEEVLIGTRWKYGKADLYGYIMEAMEEDKGGGFTWYVRSAIENDKPIFPERFTMEWFEAERKRQGSYLFSCFPAGSPVLMADWSEKAIQDIQLGDEVVGFETAKGDGLGRKTKLVKAKVIEVHHRRAPIVRITTSVGRIIYCTKDHKWWTRRAETHQAEYLPASVGRELASVYTPLPPQSQEEQRALDWIGGMMDGEGSISGSSAQICQSESANPGLCRAIEENLRLCGIAFQYSRKHNTFSKHGSGQYYLLGGRSIKIKLLQHARMFKTDRFRDNLWHLNGTVMEVGGNHRVMQMEYAGEGDVYNIGTTTGNYVAYGYATKNCNNLNSPSPPEGGDFEHSWIRTYRLACHLEGGKPHYNPDDRKTLVPEDGSPVVTAGELVRVSFYDPSSGGASASAENAIIVAGMDHRRRIFVLEAWSKQCGYGHAIEWWHRHNDRLRPWKNCFEDVGSQKEIEEIIQMRRNPCEFIIGKPVKLPDGSYRQVPCGKTHNALKPRPHKPPGGSQHKEERIRMLAQAAFEERRVYIDFRMEKLRKQIVEFPHGELVDLLDALAYAISLLRPPMSEDTIREQRRRSEERGIGRHSLVHSERDYGGYA